MRRANRFGAKVNFDLPWAMQAAGKEKFDRIEFQTHLFAQLAAQTCFGLFAPIQKSPGYSPTAVGSKDMIEQEDSIVVVKDQRSGSGREAPVAKAHHATPHPPRQPPPNRAEKICQHQTKRISRSKQRIRSSTIFLAVYRVPTLVGYWILDE